MERDLIKSFRENGFVRIETWPELSELSAIAEKELNWKYSKLTIKSRSVFKTSSVRSLYQLLPALMNENSLLRKLVHSYLRSSDVSYHGFMRFKLLADKHSAANYHNSLWHADGCGIRLKAFLYLTDVPLPEEGGRPTLIWPGSNRNLWW